MLAVIGLLACSLCAGAEPPAHPSATPVKHNSLKVCNQQADAEETQWRCAHPVREALPDPDGERACASPRSSTQATR